MCTSTATGTGTRYQYWYTGPGTRYWNQCTTTIRALLVYIIFTLYRVEYMALRYQIEIRIVTLSRIEYDTAMPWNNYAIIRQRP